MKKKTKRLVPYRVISTLGACLLGNMIMKATMPGRGVIIAGEGASATRMRYN